MNSGLSLEKWLWFDPSLGGVSLLHRPTAGGEESHLLRGRLPAIGK